MTLTESPTIAPTEAKVNAPVQVASPTPAAPLAALPEPRPFRLSLARYHEAIAAGVLTENDRIELIHGELIEKMSIRKRHRDCVDQLNGYFTVRYIQTHICAVQNPVSLPPDSEPELDFAIIDRETYKLRTGNPEPADVRLLIEVADESLHHDRTKKATLYATAGIAEYWIINLKDDQVEVHTQPDPSGGVYNSIQRYARDAMFVSPFCGEVTAADLLVS